jgi:GntR family phosphonate transport system transcriptional regulator
MSATVFGYDGESKAEFDEVFLTGGRSWLPGGRKTAKGESMIQRGMGVAIWRQIEQSIEADIGRDVYKPGDRLPTEADYAVRFEVNRHTVRRAIAALESRGLVRVEQGRGIFLQDYALHYNVSRRTRFSENLRQQQLSGHMRLLRALTLPATAKVAQALCMTEGQPVLQLDTLRLVEGRPVSMVSHYFPAERFMGLADWVGETGSITAALARFGVHDYERLESRITARLPDTELARLLQQPRTQPVLYVESVNVDAAGVPIEFGMARFAGDAVQLVVAGAT